MKQEYEMSVAFGNGETRKGIITIEKSGLCKLSLDQDAPGVITGEGSDLFSALMDLRERLERLNCALLCNGSRKNIVVSGMSRQMSGGRKGYLVQLGKQARREDLVDIFDFAERSAISSVPEQKAFYQDWISSLGC